MQKVLNDTTLETQPFPGSKKVYVQGSRSDMRVPMREVALSGEGQKNPQ